MKQAQREPNEQDVARHAEILARIAADEGGASDKLQSRLERIERLWRPVQAAYSIRDSISPRRGVVPSAEDVVVVARLHVHASREVRQRVVNALRHARTHAAAVVPVIRALLRDDELLVQAAAARAAYDMRMGVELTTELLEALDAPAWKVRVYAAAALASTRHLDRAAEIFVALRPVQGEGPGAARAAEIWRSLVDAFPPETGIKVPAGQ